jgi:hypothetical protein
MHETPQFTPAQILEAGRRAEAEGKIDYAVQFYRHLTDHYARAPEATDAWASLRRLSTQRTGGPHTTSPAVDGAAAQRTNLPVVTSPAPRRPVAGTPRDDYRAGRMVAQLLAGAGWLALASGLLVVGLAVAAHFTEAKQLQQLLQQLSGLGPLLAVSYGMAAAGGGLIAIFWGQFARATFDTANATRALAELERGRKGRRA